MNSNLESACFSQSDEDEEMLFIPNSDLLKQYNVEYSMIVKEVEHFLKESTQCIQRFVSFHNFGVNFNLPHLLSNLVNIETSFRGRLSHSTHSSSKQQKDPKLIAKNKYQSSFNALIHRMSGLLTDLIDCEIQFKKNYFGMKIQQRPRKPQERLRHSRSPMSFSVSSMTKSSTSQKVKLQDFIENEEKEQRRQAELRTTLNQRLKPKTSVIKTECKPEYSTTENLYRLNEKIDLYIQDIKSTRNREEKLVELFNLNRVKKIHSSEPPTQCFTPPSNISVISPRAEQTEGEEQMDSILDELKQTRKDSDSFTEKGFNGRHFFKKRTQTMKNQY